MKGGVRITKMSENLESRFESRYKGINLELDEVEDGIENNMCNCYGKEIPDIYRLKKYIC
jgi:hypothetical protein